MRSKLGRSIAIATSSSGGRSSARGRATALSALAICARWTRFALAPFASEPPTTSHHRTTSYNQLYGVPPSPFFHFHALARGDAQRQAASRARRRRSSPACSACSTSVMSRSYVLPAVSALARSHWPLEAALRRSASAGHAWSGSPPPRASRLGAPLAQLAARARTASRGAVTSSGPSRLCCPHCMRAVLVGHTFHSALPPALARRRTCHAVAARWLRKPFEGGGRAGCMRVVGSLRERDDSPLCRLGCAVRAISSRRGPPAWRDPARVGSACQQY